MRILAFALLVPATQGLAPRAASTRRARSTSAESDASLSSLSLRPDQVTLSSPEGRWEMRSVPLFAAQSMTGASWQKRYFLVTEKPDLIHLGYMYPRTPGRALHSTRVTIIHNVYTGGHTKQPSPVAAEPERARDGPPRPQLLRVARQVVVVVQVSFQFPDVRAPRRRDPDVSLGAAEDVFRGAAPACVLHVAAMAWAAT